MPVSNWSSETNRLVEVEPKHDYVDRVTMNRGLGSSTDARVEEIDLRDGRRDGKLTKNVTECPVCQRTMSRRYGRCFYCGHEGEKDPFDGI